MAEMVLVGEDERQIADLLEMFLRAEGYRTERGRTGKEILQLWRSAQPDAILLDLMLPELDGLSVLRQIRAESSVPILIVTARVEDIDRLIGLELGADDYILKPFNPRVAVKVEQQVAPHPLHAQEGVNQHSKQCDGYQRGDQPSDHEGFSRYPTPRTVSILLPSWPRRARRFLMWASMVRASGASSSKRSKSSLR